MDPDRSSVELRIPSQSLGFESALLPFRSLIPFRYIHDVSLHRAVLIINEHLALYSDRNMCELNCLRVVIAPWSNAYQIIRLGVGMNRSARG